VYSYVYVWIYFHMCVFVAKIICTLALSFWLSYNT